MEELIKFDIKEVKTDLLRAINECSQRGLLHTTKWYNQLIYNQTNISLLWEMKNVFFLQASRIELFSKRC